MRVRICPLCDSEMKKAHRCDVCGSFIWNPDYMDVHYNAQARGMGEEDCAYGSEHDVMHHRSYDETESVEGNQAEANYQEAQYEKQQNNYKRTSTPSGRQQPSAVPGLIRRILWIFGILWVLLIAAQILQDTDIKQIFGGSKEEEPRVTASQIDDEFSEAHTEAIAVPEAETQYLTLSDAEVEAFGRECDYYNHLELSGPKILEGYKTFVESMGITEYDEGVEVYNEVCTGTLEGEAIEEYYLEQLGYVEVTEAGRIGYLVCNYDTTSLNVHYLEAQVLDGATVEQVLNMWKEQTGYDFDIPQIMDLCDTMPYDEWQYYYTEDQMQMISLYKTAQSDGDVYSMYLE